jgi:ADP-glucose pyrophosphorylase
LITESVGLDLRKLHLASTLSSQDAKNQDVENVLILSGDHLYRMDYMDFVQVSQSPLISPSLYFC